jgi:hypothetical protein
LIGTKPNVLVESQFAIVAVVVGHDRHGRWFALTVRQGSMFVVMLDHDFAPFDPEIM